MPGRIMQGFHQAGSNNPVFMMDEVDKIGATIATRRRLWKFSTRNKLDFRDNYLGFVRSIEGYVHNNGQFA